MHPRVAMHMSTFSSSAKAFFAMIENLQKIPFTFTGPVDAKRAAIVALFRFKH
jgi:hypothetical protein